MGKKIKKEIEKTKESPILKKKEGVQKEIEKVEKKNTTFSLQKKKERKTISKSSRNENLKRKPPSPINKNPKIEQKKPIEKDSKTELQFPIKKDSKIELQSPIKKDSKRKLCISKKKELKTECFFPIQSPLNKKRFLLNKNIESSKTKKPRQEDSSPIRKKNHSKKVEKKAFQLKWQFFRFQSFYSFFFRDGHLEKGKKITFEATKLLLDKTIGTNISPIYKKKKPIYMKR